MSSIIAAVVLAGLLGVGIWLVIGEAGRSADFEQLQQQQQQMQEDIQSLSLLVDELERRDQERLQQLESYTDPVDVILEILLAEEDLQALLLIDDDATLNDLVTQSLAVRAAEDQLLEAISQPGGETGTELDGDLIAAKAQVLSSRTELANKVLGWMEGDPSFVEDQTQIIWLRTQLAEVQRIASALLESGSRPDAMGRQWATTDERRARYTFALVWLEEIQRETNRLLRNRLLSASLR